MQQLRPPGVHEVPDGLDALAALCSYESTGKDLVLALKRGNRRAAVPLLGCALAESLRALHDDHGAPGGVPPLVTWAPTTPPRRRRRGFDQAELLAHGVAGALGTRAFRTLRRLGPAQSGLAAPQRLAGVDFAPLAPAVQRSDTWLVVDDVVTSGATMSCAARALRRAGADWVLGAAVAVTRRRR